MEPYNGINEKWQIRNVSGHKGDKKMRKKQTKITVIALSVLLGLSGCGSLGASKGYKDYTVKKEQYVAEYTGNRRRRLTRRFTTWQWKK